MHFLRKAALASVGNIVCIFLIQIGNIALSRILGPAGIGQYRLWITASTITSTVAVMGIGTANIYFLNNVKAPKTQVVTNAFKFYLILAPITAAVIMAAIRLFPGYFGAAPLLVTASFSLGAGLGIGVILFRQILVAQFEVRRMVGIDLLQNGLLLAGWLTLAFMGRLTVSSALPLTLLGAIASVLCLLIFLKESIDIRCAFDWPLFFNTLKYGIKLSLAHTIFLLSAEFSYIILGYLKYGQFTPLGLYSRAATITGLILLIPSNISPLLMSQWSSVTGDPRARQVEAAVRILLVYGISISLIITVSGRYIIWLLYGKEFIGAQEALVLLAPSAAALSLFIVFGNLLNAAGRATACIWISLGTFVVLAGSSLIFIPLLGIRGAALGALCGNGFAAIASFICAWKFCDVSVMNCLIPNKTDWFKLYNAVASYLPGRKRGAVIQ